MTKEKQNFIMGRQPVLELLRTQQDVEKIWLLKGTKGEFEIELRNALKSKNIPVQHVPLVKLNKLSNHQNHQGVIAFVSLVKYYEVQDIIYQDFSSGKSPMVVVLDGVTDVRNLGAISRTAEIFGASAIVTPVNNTAIINEISFKISAGALAHIPMCREKSLTNALEKLKELGLTIYAADQNAEKEIQEMNFTDPCAIVFGDEGMGVSSHLMKRVDQVFSIPQTGKTESLNVSVAAGIALFHARR